MPVHDAVPALVSAPGDRQAAALASESLLLRWEENPFLDALQLLFGAQVHLASGRERHAVLDSGTGVEMLVSELLRAVGAARDSFAAAPALRAHFRARYEHHLPNALGDGYLPAQDLDGTRAAWLEQGYRLRNDVVHQGAAAEPEPARGAVESAWALVESCGRLLRESPDTASLGGQLQVVWHEA